jgi:hypothetical protein
LQKSYTREEHEEILSLIKKHGGVEKAAKELNMSTIKLYSRQRLAKESLELKVPDGQVLKGTSILYDKDGNEKLKWIKTSKDLEKQKEILLHVVEGLKADLPKEKPVFSLLKNISPDLLSAYFITDYHIGCLSWKGETGEDWNVTIAEETLFNWFATAIDSAPKSHTAIFAQLGDFLHFDGLEAVTPTSGHVLDADARYQEIVEVVIRVVRRIIKMLLGKHQHVHIIMAEGNHDLASSVWLRALFSALYEDEPRVTVDNTHTPFYAFEWGDTSLFFHHGHKAKMGKISSSFAGIYREIFGRTKYSYAHMGHYHHRDVKENSLMIVEQHPTLAAKDAYSARGGYISQRGASVISYCKKYGEVARATIRPEMFEGISTKHS